MISNYWEQLFSLIRITHLPFRPSENVCNESDFKEIAFESIFTAFVVLAFGIGVAILSFMIERMKKKQHPSNLKMSSKQEIGKFGND